MYSTDIDNILTAMRQYYSRYLGISMLIIRTIILLNIQFIYLANENIEINCKHCLLHAGLRKMHQVLRENSQRFSFNYISFGYSHVLRDIVVDNLGLLKRDHIRNHILEMFNIHDSAYK